MASYQYRTLRSPLAACCWPWSLLERAITFPPKSTPRTTAITADQSKMRTNSVLCLSHLRAPSFLRARCGAIGLQAVGCAPIRSAPVSASMRASAVW